MKPYPTGREHQDKAICTELPPVDNARWKDVAAYLGKRKLSFTLAKKNGWYPSTYAGDSYVRVVIPCAATNPKNRYWQARDIESASDIRYQSPSAARAGAVCVVMPDGAAKGTVLCEGPMDALAAAGAGFIGIAWMGMLPTDDQFQTARAILTGPVLVVSDEGDRALDAATRIWRRFPGALLIRTYPFKDLADTPPEGREELLTYYP